ncbi:MAG: cysteine hydrolase [Thermoleophilia bacterium]|nr:cysteine hydrolase [Thermoleophilia bacterium]
MGSILDMIRSADAVLMVVDVQNDFCHESGAIAKRGVDVSLMQRVVPAILDLVQVARDCRIPVVFTKSSHSVWTDSPIWMERSSEANLREAPACRAGEWGEDSYLVTPAAEDRVVTKHRYSAFYGTDLDLTLRARGIENIVLTGVMTNVCVESTARDACIRDYRVFLVDDCCATATVEEHEATVHNIGAYFGTVVSAEQVRLAMRRPIQKSIQGR